MKKAINRCCCSAPLQTQLQESNAAALCGGKEQAVTSGLGGTYLAGSHRLPRVTHLCSQDKEVALQLAARCVTTDTQSRAVEVRGRSRRVSALSRAETVPRKCLLTSD